MFTGIIEEIGKINSLKRIGNSLRIEISVSKILEELKIDDSVAINGVCLTAVEVKSSSFVAEAVDETLRKTTLSKLKTNEKVNIERALTLSTRLGGHIVLGHIDTIGKILDIRKESLGILFKFNYPQEYYNLIVRVGSIAIDGVSLTISEYDRSSITVSVIPHTFENTIFYSYKKGTEINIEFDIIGKYIEKIVTGKSKFEENLKNFLKS
jgi:riboflavin synthase